MRLYVFIINIHKYYINKTFFDAINHCSALLIIIIYGIIIIPFIHSLYHLKVEIMYEICSTGLPLFDQNCSKTFTL